MDYSNPIVVGVTVALAGAVVSAGAGIGGYFLGKLRDFRDRKLRIYEAELPLLIRAIFEPTEVADAQVSTALVRVWLLANRDTAKKVATAMSYWVDPRRGNLVSALQEAIVAARRDMQWWPFWPNKIAADEVSHFFMKLKPSAAAQGS